MPFYQQLGIHESQLPHSIISILKYRRERERRAFGIRILDTIYAHRVLLYGFDESKLLLEDKIQHMPSLPAELQHRILEGTVSQEDKAMMKKLSCIIRVFLSSTFNGLFGNVNLETVG